MSKIFDNSVPWNENTKNILGLPRPFFMVGRYWRKRKNKIYLTKKIPIPWQSFAVFNESQMLGLDEKNEQLVYKNNLCPYCGIKIEKNEYVIRWTNKKFTDSSVGGKVLSDIHPFHIECMRQARIFCPFMRMTTDEEFEFGLFVNLKNNAIVYIKSLKDLTKLDISNI